MAYITNFRVQHRIFFVPKTEFERHIDNPMATEQIEGFRKHVIVQKAGINRKEAHQQYNVASVEKNTHYFTLDPFPFEFFFGSNKTKTEHRQN